MTQVELTLEPLREIKPSALIDVVTGESIFVPGAAKREFYRVCDGQIKLRWLSPDNDADLIEFMGEGDFFGLGFLDHHICGAAAIAPSVLEPIPIKAAAELSTTDNAIKRREAIETHREFAHCRSLAIRSVETPLPKRLAAFLSFIARTNSREGRDPMLIGDDITGHAVAAYLKVDQEELGQALKQLNELGAIETAPGGLRIRDPEFLDYIADAKKRLLI